MDEQPNGGPAFPCECGGDPKTNEHQTGSHLWQQYGMTLLDYFAARAPLEIPAWFRPSLPSVRDQTAHLRKAIIDEVVQLPRLRDAIQSWRKAPCYDLKDAGESREEKAWLAKYQGAFEDYEEACAAQRVSNDQARYFAWRWHYAAEMLKARSA
jgi:hypothetical protein